MAAVPFRQSRNFGGGSFGQQFSLRVTYWDGRALRSRSIFAALISLSADTRATCCSRGGKIYGVNETEVTAPIRFSTGIGDHRQRQAELEKAEQIEGGAHHMRATMQVPQTVEPLPCEAQAGQQPDQEQAALVVMADMLKSVAVLGIVEA